MSTTSNATFAQWAEQIYGPSSRSTSNTLGASCVDYLVHTKYLRDASTSGLTSPSKQPSSQRSTSSSLNHETRFTASTQETTPEKTPRTSSESPAAINWGYERLWSPDPIAIPEWYYKSLSRVDQLEYFVKVKIEVFRVHMQVHVPLHSRQSQIDKQEGERRRRFFHKNGEDAFRARYIDSDYTGCVEFLYIDH